MNVSLSVLIPTHGRPRLLERTLESVARCTLPDGYEELVVIENGSRAGTEKLVEDLPERLNARYMHRERANKSYALNQALETIKDGLVVFFDDDVRVFPETIMHYARAAKKYGRGHFFGGSVKVDRQSNPPDWLNPSLPESVKGYTASNKRKWYLGFNWASYSKDLKKCGKFNPKFGPGSTTGATGQEVDMQRRLRNSKIIPVGVENATVKHDIKSRNVNVRWMLKRKRKKGIFEYHQGSEKNYLIKTLARGIYCMVKGVYKCEINMWVKSISHLSILYGYIGEIIKHKK